MMLGQFLEISVNAPRIAQSLEFYRSLGFRDFQVGDILPGPYAVIGDSDVAIGLHHGEHEAPVLTFVRPNLQDHLRAFKRRGVDFEFTVLEDDQFHQAAFADPNGQLIKLVEARTCAPPTASGQGVTGCGRFLEYSLTTHSVEASAAFWQALGLRADADGNGSRRWIRLSGCGLTLGLYEGAPFPSGISFSADSLSARLDYLRAKGLDPRPSAPLAERGRDAATLTAPEGTALYLLAAQAPHERHTV